MKVMRVREREILRGVACRRGLPLPDERCPLLSTMRVRWRVLRTCPDVSFFQTSRASAEMSVMFHKREQLRRGATRDGSGLGLRAATTCRQRQAAEARARRRNQRRDPRRSRRDAPRVRKRGCGAGLGWATSGEFSSHHHARHARDPCGHVARCQGERRTADFVAVGLA